MSSDLERSLQGVWEACKQLPEDAACFNELDPQERRAAHDLGVRIQDRLMATLAELVVGMTQDGVELVGSNGVLEAFTSAPGQENARTGDE